VQQKKKEATKKLNQNSAKKEKAQEKKAGSKRVSSVSKAAEKE
jgi:hypothetical protein